VPHRSCRRILGSILLGALVASAFAAEPTADEILKKLKPEHPRLFLLKADWDVLKARCEKDPLVKPWFQRQKRRADDSLKEPPIEHKLIGPRLLDQSRKALGRITLWAAMYRITGDKKYAERATKEMLTAAAFKDWNTSHYLDTAEMTAALAIGYDWLFDVLSDDEKKAIRQGLMTNGLNPGLNAYTKNDWWTKCTHNWSQVCNGGMAMGALALGDVEPKVCGEIIRYAIQRIEPAMESFRPDGGWDEGPGYWSYAMMYNVFFIDCLESALGTDYDLKKVPGFGDAGLFRMHSTGPFNQAFNFADAHHGVGSAWQMFWLAKAFNQPAYAAHEMAFAERGGDWWHIAWAPEQAPKPEDLLRVPTAAAFKRIHVVFMRSAWNDPKAVYVGFKGGDNKANHSHLDLGTFVLDAQGKRWAEDLGADNYNLPDYFGKKRWSYYRLRTEGHNTITVNGENQDPKAEAPLLAFQHAPGKTFAVADLTAAYKDQKAKRIWRGMALLNNRQVVTIDEVELAQPGEVAWTMHTPAKIDASGAKAVLTLEGEKLTAEILEPADAKFSSAAASPPDPQTPLKDVTRLMVRLPNTTQTRLVVCLTPGDAPASKLELEPLAKWAAAGVASGPSTGAGVTASASKKKEESLKVPAPPPPAQKTVDETKLGVWVERLQGHILKAAQGGAKPTARLALVGERSEQVKILGADEHGLSVEVGGGKLPVGWKQLDNRALAALAQAFAGEQDAEGHALLGVFLMATGRMDDGERELSSALLQDAKIEAWVKEARALVKVP
jgi:hypothetical protein